ncbi:MAG: hypothetical protein J6M64_01705 [Oscillospiraceae bacterium]|nr:hypothetical protein [Oscillospiraceae bacterium]
MRSRIEMSWKSGVIMTFVVLIMHRMQPVGQLTIFVEALVRFLVYAVLFFIVITVADFIRSNTVTKKGNTKKQNPYKMSVITDSISAGVALIVFFLTKDNKEIQAISLGAALGFFSMLVKNLINYNSFKE